MDDFKTLLSRLCAIPTVSGFENRAAAEILRAAGEGFDEARCDALGNVILVRRCGREDAPRIMLDAHVDEVGAVVSEILDGGFIKVCPAGGLDPTVLSSTEVVIYGKEPVYGLFAVTPPHLMTKEDEGKVPVLDEMKVDTGYDRDELSGVVSVGDPVGYRAPGAELCRGVIAGHGFDDKSCGAALICAALRAPREKLAGDVYVVLSTREENGGGGAAVVARKIEPDFCIVTDVNFARAPGVEARESGVRGKGPMVSLSAVTTRLLTKQILAAAKDAGIPVQPVVESSRTGTNADHLLTVGNGTPLAVVSIPLTGMHTPSETLSLADAEEFIKLIIEVISSRDIAECWRDRRSPSLSVTDGLYGKGGDGCEE